MSLRLKGLTSELDCGRHLLFDPSFSIVLQRRCHPVDGSADEHLQLITSLDAPETALCVCDVRVPQIGPSLSLEPNPYRVQKLKLALSGSDGQVQRPG